MEFPDLRIAAPDEGRFPVKDLYRLDRRLLWAYEGMLVDTDQWRPSPFEEQAAWFVLHGRAELKYTGLKPIEIAAGNWGFPAAGVPARQRFARQSQIISVRFNCTWPGGARLFDFDRPLILPGARHPELESAARMLVRTTAGHFPDLRSQQLVASTTPTFFMSQQAHFHTWLEVWMQTMLTLGYRFTFPARGDPRVSSACRWLDARMTQTTFSRNELADHIGMSSSQLDRLFVRALRQTPRAYHEQQRLLTARQDLGVTSEPIKVIGFRLGFRRASHFSAWFQRATGVSPRACRNAKPASV